MHQYLCVYSINQPAAARVQAAFINFPLDKPFFDGMFGIFYSLMVQLTGINQMASERFIQWLIRKTQDYHYFHGINIYKDGKFEDEEMARFVAGYAEDIVSLPLSDSDNIKLLLQKIRKYYGNLQLVEFNLRL